MVWCDADGTIWPGQNDKEAPRETCRECAPPATYIGVIANERLLPWTPELAAKRGVVAVNSEEEWREVLAQIKSRNSK